MLLLEILDCLPLDFPFRFQLRQFFIPLSNCLIKFLLEGFRVSRGLGEFFGKTRARFPDIFLIGLGQRGGRLQLIDLLAERVLFCNCLGMFLAKFGGMFFVFLLGTGETRGDFLFFLCKVGKLKAQRLDLLLMCGAFLLPLGEDFFAFLGAFVALLDQCVNRAPWRSSESLPTVASRSLIAASRCFSAVSIFFWNSSRSCFNCPSALSRSWATFSRSLVSNSIWFLVAGEDFPGTTQPAHCPCFCWQQPVWKF